MSASFDIRIFAASLIGNHFIFLFPFLKKRQSVRRAVIIVATLLLGATLGRGQTSDSSHTVRRPFDRLWDALADPDAAKAYRAIGTLTKTPKETILFFADKLQKPTAAPDPKTVEGFIKDLSHDSFAVREKATQELTNLGEFAEPALREFLAGNPALEASQRMQQILDRLAGPTPPEALRAIRAVETLEHIPLPEAKNLLAKCAAGAGGQADARSQGRAGTPGQGRNAATASAEIAAHRPV